jgi:hypothetical protein
MDEPFVISRYSRAEAMEDGVLLDVTSAAREAGIRFPTALTRELFDRCVAVPAGVAGQDERGRLWDILWMLRIRLRGRSVAELLEGPAHFSVLVRNDNLAAHPFGSRPTSPSRARRGRRSSP